MTNRRSILSTLCTGALALLAPVVAWAKPRRWVGFHNRGVKPMVITPHGVVDAQHYEALGREHIRARANNILLRALLAEARIYIHGQANSERYQYERHEELDDLLSRIDDALR